VGSVCIVQDITELKITEDSLRLTQLSVDSAVDLICWIDADGRLLYVNDAFCERHGYSRQELLNMTIFDVDPNLSPKMWPERWRQRKERGALAFESLHRTKEGEVFPVEVTTRIVERAGEEVNVGFARDLTERKTAEAALKESEEQLRQAQKMEALGQLAGGIAHDFNNLLTSIIGNSFLALAALSPEDPNYELIKDIKEVGERAAGLTRQILAFSRRQVLKPQVVYLNDILLQMEPLLRRTLGEDIDLRFVARPDLEKTEVDPHQMEQVLMNLALNVRDAMPEGGSLIIETANVDLDVRYCKTHPEVKPGRYVALSVTDTGCGMDSETMSHIFEPFFTTKETGKGTGLGLSTAFGVVKQSGGAISVYSEPGRGTTFKVYLPVSGRAVAPQPDYQRETAPGRGKETILLVEDEAPVRHLFHRILADAGYNVLEVGSASEAQGLLDQTGAPPDLLLADVVLPGGKSGPELAEALLARYPGLAVIFMSGYTREAVLYNGHLDEKTEFLEKPFLPEVVLHKVRAVLDARAAKIQEPAEFGATREAANSAAPTRAVIARTEATAVCRVARHPAKAHRAARQRH
jgi:PAS domain S-box-containing protein